MQGSVGFKRFYFDHIKKQHWKKRFLQRFFLKKTIEKEFYKRKKYHLNLQNPITISEKIQWMKYYVRDSMITQCVDKYKVRKYVSQILGNQFLIPLLGVYDSVEAIDLNELPEEFVLKPNHASGEVVICKKGEKEQINWHEVADTLRKWMRENYFDLSGEWGYKNISRKIICEKLLPGNIIDYRIFCIDGEPVLVNPTRDAGHSDRQGWTTIKFVPVEDRFGRLSKDFQKPNHWDEMLEVARKLADGFPFVRVDLYNIEGKIYFSELTFYPSSGWDYYLSTEWDLKLGEMYDLMPFREELRQKGIIRHWYHKPDSLDE